MKPSAKPYPGLRPFETAEKDLFFGREAECAILVDKILAHRLTLLFAASGAGKTSLLRAAVLPELVDPEGENLTVVVYRDWVEEPIAGLKQAIVAAVEASGRVPADAFGEDLGALSLFELCELTVLFVRPPLVLMLDQFEELFRYQRRAATFERFLVELGRLVAERSLPVSVVLSMREDFALELNALKPFLPGPLFENYFRLERMPVEQAREAIEAPAKKAGFEYEAELIEALLVDLADRDDEVSPVAELGAGHRTVEPPYLQIVCSELWELEQEAEGRLLRFSTYAQQGRAAGLSKRYVERILGRLSAREKVLASRAFDHLITRRGTKMAYTVADLASAIGTPEAALEATLDRLQKAKILRQQSRRGVFWYELHHDLFSRIVEDWNQKFKTGQRRRQVAAGAALCVLAAGVLWVAYDAVVNWTTYYLRLDVRPGLSDAVEVYRGKPGSADFLRLGGYLAETGIDRRDIEPHRSFDVRLLQNLELVEVEAASFLRAGKHVELAWRAGDTKEALAIAAEALNTTDGEVAGRVADRVKQFGSLESLELLNRMQAARATPEAAREAMAETLEPSPREEGRSRVGEKELIARLSSSNPQVRRQAADSLESQGGQLSVAPLIALLSDPDWIMRRTAASALGSLGSQEASAPLTGLLFDSDPNVRQSAAEALGSLGSLEASALLIRLSGVSWTGRLLAANVQVSMGSPEASAPLLALLSDPDWNMRYVAIIALESMGSPEASAPLLALLTDPESNVRKSAAEALGSLGSPKASVPLLALLSDPESSVRASAAGALGSLGSLEASAPLLALLSDPESEVRANAAYGLGSLGSQEASAPLIALLSDLESGVRLNAAYGLGSLGSPMASAPLIALLSDLEQSDAAHGLGLLGIPEATDPLMALLSDHESDVRQSAAEALGLLGSPEASAPLIVLLSDPESAVRGSAARALGLLGSSEAVPALIALLATEAPGRREPVMLALAALGEASARDGIVAVYLEEERRPKFRLPAAVALLTLGDDRGLAEIQAAATSKLFPARAQVAELLGQAKATAGLPLLDKLLDDPHRRVREAAITALGQIGSPSSVPRLREIAVAPKQVPASYSQLAADALGKIGNADAIAALQEAVRVNEATLGVRAYRWLGDLGATVTLPQLQERLLRLETEHRAWRQLRDRATIGMAPEVEKTHSQRIATERPRTAWGSPIAYAIARIDREQGVRLLSHDIASVRTGAAFGLSRSRDLALVERLEQARATEADYPFSVAAFQVIDQTLRFVEHTGGPKERETLVELLGKVKDREAVCTRVEYTIHKLDPEKPVTRGACSSLLPKSLEDPP